MILLMSCRKVSHAGATDLGHKQMRAGMDSSAGPSFCHSSTVVNDTPMLMCSEKIQVCLSLGSPLEKHVDCWVTS